MKAGSAMKTTTKKVAPMKKVIRKPKIASGALAKAMVLKGAREKTTGGLSKDDLQKNRRGKTVSKKQSARGKKSWKGSTLERMSTACKEARKKLGLTGFVPMGGKTAEGQKLLAKVRAIMAGK